MDYATRPVKSRLKFEDPAKRLERSSSIGEPDLTHASDIIAEQMGVERIDLASIEPTEELSKILAEGFCRKNVCTPFRLNKKELSVALSDPANIETLDIINNILPNYKVTVYYSPEKDIITFLNVIFSGHALVETASNAFSPIETNEKELESLNLIEESNPYSNFVNLLFRQALRDGASDIYIEQNSNTARIRFRIDGTCHEMPSPPKNYIDQIISRIKILSKIDISKKRESHDGRFSVKYGEKESDMRVSTFPSICGETLTIRILNKDKKFLSINSLGMTEGIKSGYLDFLQAQYGLCFVSGPTGSGKTTTLYAGLNELNVEGTKIITIENPVEYQIDGLTQQEIDNTKITFSDALKASLRQAPDVIMVGEVRDFETADIACKAALTGHIVMSTIHTNNALSTINRLKSMGVKDHLIEGSLHTVIAQRLVKKLCDCKNGNVPVGCRKCFHTGNRGRLAVYELLRVKGFGISPSISYEEADRLLKQRNYQTMYDDGLLKFENNLISQEELNSLLDFRIY